MVSKWTVFYYTDDFFCKVRRALFGINGCHKHNADELRYGPAYIEMVNKNANTCRFIDYGHVVVIDCNYSYEESCQEIRAEYMRQMKEKMDVNGEKIILPETPVMDESLYG